MSILYTRRLQLALIITLTHTSLLVTGLTENSTNPCQESPNQDNPHISSYLSALMRYFSINRKNHQTQKSDADLIGLTYDDAEALDNMAAVQDDSSILEEAELQEKAEHFLETTPYKSFPSLYEHIKKIRPNIAIPRGNYYIDRPIISAEEMRTLLRASICRATQTLSQAHWVGENPKQHPLFLKINYLPEYLAYQNYLAYVEKRVVEPGSTVIICGDLHGDILSLGSLTNMLIKDGYLDNNLKLKQNTYMVFLGDYVDRGYYGIECLYLLHRLKLANDAHVILLRGNHEDIDLTSRYGFKQELFDKYDVYQAQEIISDTHRSFDLMPVAFFLGCRNQQSGLTHYAICCHAGLEPRYSSKKLLTDPEPHAYELLNPSLLETRDSDSGVITKAFSSLGFLWCDFNTAPNTATHLTQNRGRSLSKEESAVLLQQYSTDLHKVFCVIGAHQHGILTKNPMMKLIYDIQHETPHHQGVAKLWLSPPDQLHNTNHLWNGAVVKFGVAPDTCFNTWHPNQDFDLKYFAYGNLTTGEEIGDWRLDVKYLRFPDDIIPSQLSLAGHQEELNPPLPAQL